MKCYKVTVIEFIGVCGLGERVVNVLHVKAETEEDAVGIVRGQYNNPKYLLQVDTE